MEKKERNASFELLRIVSMCMVIMLHALGKSGVLNNLSSGGANTFISWILESLSIQAVNVYVLISGYFLVKGKFKTGRFIELICQVLFYSVVGLIIGLAFNTFETGYINNYTLLEFFLPIHSDEYWFVSKYIIMYMFSPVLALAVNKMTQKQLQVTISLLVIYESLIKSISPIVFVPDKRGYDALWFILLFLLAGYISLYGLKFIDSAGKGWALYFASALLIFLEEFVVSLLMDKTGHFAELHKVSYDYNHILVLLSSLGLFMAFVLKKQITGKASKIICALSPMTLGVYLFHENPAIRFKWQEFFGISEAYKGNSVKYIAVLLAAVIGIYIAGTAFDFIRKVLFEAVKKTLGKLKISSWPGKLDGYFNGQE